MRILLIDADSKDGFPNLALMKLSAYYKTLGYGVDLIKGIPSTTPLIDYERVLISCIFHQNKERVVEYAKQLNSPYEIGGSGFSLDKADVLKPEIEYIRPDYKLYDLDYSVGFTSRGCIRNCSFCIVQEKEGYICDASHVAEFWDKEHKKIMLLDNNFLASPCWKINLEFIIEHKLKVNFNSGLDIRLITEENARLLKITMLQDWKFKKRKYTFAFDHPKHIDAIIKGLLTLRNAGNKLTPNNCMFYVLVGFNTTIKEDMERIRILQELNVSPFIMRYNSVVGKNRILLHLSRWVNRKYYQHVEFCDYDYSDSKKCYKAIFGDQPDPTFKGLGCPQSGYAWANRQLDEEPEKDIQERL